MLDSNPYGLSQADYSPVTIDAALDLVAGAMSQYLGVERTPGRVSVEAAPVRDAVRQFARVGRTAGLASDDVLVRLERRLADRKQARAPLHNAVATWAMIEYHRAG